MRRTLRGEVRERAWWKEMLGIGTNREWVLVGAIVLLFFAYTHEKQGPWQALWGAATAVGGLAVARWWKKREEHKSEEVRKPVLKLGDAEPDDSRARD